MSSCCGGGGDAVIKAKAAFGGQMQQVQNVSGNDMVRMEYVGEKVGAFTINVNGKGYRMSASPMHRVFDARPGDVQRLLATVEGLRVVRSPGMVTNPNPVAPEPLKMNWGNMVSQQIIDNASDPRAETPYAEIEAQNAKMIRDADRHIKNPPETFQGLDEATTTGFQGKGNPDTPPGKLAIAPAFEDDYAVTSMTISDVKNAIEHGTDNITLFGWLQAEQSSEKARKGVIDAIEKALER